MTHPLSCQHSRWRRVRLVVVRPSGTSAPDSIIEVISSLFHALQSLGCSVDMQENEPILDGTNIVFMAHLLPPARLSEIPPGSIIYNLEQISNQSPWVGPVYRTLLSSFTVWDYSSRNLTAIASIADCRNLHLVPIGYVPQLTHIRPAPIEDIDVLFYGAINQRRSAILLSLQQAGLSVTAETRIRGEARDKLISRAKVVLNMHFYPTAIFEIVRVSYLLANQKAVVGECGPHTEIDGDISEAIAPANYDQLCDTVLELLQDEARRFELARRGKEIFAKRHLPDILARAIAETDAASREPRGRAPVASSSDSEPADIRRTQSKVSAPIHTGPRTKRILFHAINGKGVGHVVRLSVIASALQNRAEIAFFSTCAFANRYWPGKIFGVSDRLDERFELTLEQRHLLAFHLALKKFSPDIVVFDTHWPYSVMGQLRDNAIRTVLILRMLALERMDQELRLAIRDFSSVLIPHHLAELERTYEVSPELIQLMTVPPCLCIGPVARTTAHRNRDKSVIFTLGGGGEYWHLSEARSVRRFLDEFKSAASVLMDKLAIEPIFAAGPLFNQDDDKLSPFKVVRSHNLHEMFGPDTIVVTRGGYNTCWEAVAAGAGLIIVGEHIAHGVEDVGTRGRFLAAEGVAKHVQINASEILKACTELIERPASMNDHYLRLSVNSGLSVASDEILGLPSHGCFAVSEPVGN
jgi:predicted glycosyltransferase